MKNLVLLSIVVLFFIGCENNTEPAKSKANLSFSISASEGSLAKINRDSLQSVTKAVITLKKGTEITYDNYNLGLINWGESSVFRTDIIEVEANELYNLTQFELRDSSNTTLFATPLEEAPLAFLVSDPLPIDVTTDVNEQKAIQVDVIYTVGYTPEDFGYPYFVVNDSSKLPFSVTVKADGDLVTADLTVTSGTYLYEQELALGKNDIYIDNNYDSYDVKISKDGYEDYEETFLYDSLYNKHLLVELVANTTPTMDSTVVAAFFADFGNQDASAYNRSITGTPTIEDIGTSHPLYSKGYTKVFRNDGFNLTNDDGKLNIDASVESYTIDGWMYRIGGLGDATFWLFYAGSGLHYYDSGKWWGHVQHGSGWSHEPQFGGVDDTWRHYAVQVTYEGAQYIVRVFVDGILRTYGSAPAASGVVTMVGTHYDATAGHRWDGIRVRKDFTLSSGTSLGQQYFNPLELYEQK